MDCRLLLLDGLVGHNHGECVLHSASGKSIIILGSLIEGTFRETKALVIIILLLLRMRGSRRIPFDNKSPYLPMALGSDMSDTRQVTV